MLNSGQAGFRTLRDEFLEASREGFQVVLVLESFADPAAFDRRFEQRRIQAESAPREGRSYTVTGTVSGDAAGVKRYSGLAIAAGSVLPVEFHPSVRLFPSWHEITNWNPEPTTIWEEFLCIAAAEHFRIVKDANGKARTATLKGNLFLASALAIDEFLLTYSDQTLAVYRERMRSLFPAVLDTWPVPSESPPVQQPVAIKGGPRVVLRERDKGPIVLGKEKPVVTDREYNVIKALLDVGANGLSKDKLDEKSGHSESRKVLAALRDSDPDWATVIHMPGKAGRGGYRIK